MSEIRYFVDYVKSNEILIEERQKRNKELIKQFMNSGVVQALVACVVGMLVCSMIKDEIKDGDDKDGKKKKKCSDK